MTETETFYRRKLPQPTAIAFASKEGRELFSESLRDGYMEGYFHLAEQFRTQDAPTFCGLSTLTMVLNTLAVDPKRVWKSPWRWYNESMLFGGSPGRVNGNCPSFAEVKINGINFDEFACLGRLNSLNMIAKRPNQKHLYTDVNEEIIIEQNETNNPYFSLADFRNDVMISCVSANDPIIIVSYSREGLNQTGDGHFSPIAGYHKGKDMVLIMDVARFKYPPHWVHIEILYNAMCRVDQSCNKTRGWIVTSCAYTPSTPGTQIYIKINDEESNQIIETNKNKKSLNIYLYFFSVIMSFILICFCLAYFY